MLPGIIGNINDTTHSRLITAIHLHYKRLMVAIHLSGKNGFQPQNKLSHSSAHYQEV
jgi:hypothetical protein